MTSPAQYGTLFVAAAGNDGTRPADRHPATANAARPWAAWTRRSAMASPPRAAGAPDGALKPDIAAPGDDIVAARAAGTSVGTRSTTTTPACPGRRWLRRTWPAPRRSSPSSTRTGPHRNSRQPDEHREGAASPRTSRAAAASTWPERSARALCRRQRRLRPGRLPAERPYQQGDYVYQRHRPGRHAHPEAEPARLCRRDSATRAWSPSTTARSSSPRTARRR